MEVGKREREWRTTVIVSTIKKKLGKTKCN